MKCQLCSKPATVHLMDVVNNEKKETHLCQACAEAQQLIKQQELNLPAILQNLIGQHLGPQSDELARSSCPACGIRYMEFRAQGRLGCPHDYSVFKAGLDPLLLLAFGSWGITDRELEDEVTGDFSRRMLIGARAVAAVAGWGALLVLAFSVAGIAIGHWQS